MPRDRRSFHGERSHDRDNHAVNRYLALMHFDGRKARILCDQVNAIAIDTQPLDSCLASNGRNHDLAGPCRSLLSNDRDVPVEYCCIAHAVADNSEGEVAATSQH